MTRLIAAAPAVPHRRNDETASLLGYVIGSAVFIAVVFGLFSVAGFHL